MSAFPGTTSVVMTTYNGERFLAEQLESIARQTSLPDELILSDDCSTDGTFAIAQAFAKRAPFATRVVVNPQRLGFTRNFIGAEQLACGELIVFCDQDDIWDNDKLQTLQQAAAETDAGLICHDIRIFRDGVTEIPSYYQLLRERDFTPAICVKGCAMAVKASFLRRVGWPPASSPMTFDLWLALLGTGLKQRHYIERPLTSHRFHDNNTSGWIASSTNRLRTKPGGTYTDTELLLDLCLKGNKNLPCTYELLDAIDHYPHWPTKETKEFKRSLRKHWNWHHSPLRRKWRKFLRKVRLRAA